MRPWLFILPLIGEIGFGIWWAQSDTAPAALPTAWQGYVEGDYLYLAAPLAGRLQTLAVQRGTPVQAGQALFNLESAPEANTVQESLAHLHAATARLEDARKGQRVSEIDAIAARLAQAKADFALAEQTFKRQTTLYQQRVTQREALDTADAAVRRNRARVAEIEAQWQTAQLGNRSDLVQALTAEVANAQASLDKARWWLAQKQVVAPTAALVFDSYYQPGEWVAAGSPVLALLPPDQRTLRFFVPEPQLSGLHLGQAVTASCDGCRAPIAAQISYIAAQAEYTPPLIYSRENRSKLVYRVEARPTSAVLLNPGQPLEVLPVPDTR